MADMDSAMKKLILVVAGVIGSYGYCAAEDALDDDIHMLDVPTVITPTRMNQSIADTPTSVTVITSDMIRDLGLRTYPEVLRLVPGMTVQDKAGNFPVVQYHGTNFQAPRRIQVLVDGISVYRTGKAEMDWTQIPAALEDVDRIEVVRGPNAASYGANSMVAVINIITRHPSESLGWQVKARTGSLDTSDQYVGYAGKLAGKHDFRLSYSRTADSGYDLNTDGDERRDSTDIKRLNFKSIFTLSDADELELSIGLLQGENQEEFVDDSQISFPDIDLENNFLQLDWHHAFSENHHLMVRAHTMNEIREQRWTSCVPQITLTSELRAMHSANPEYAATILAGGIPSGGSAQDDALAADVFARVASLGGVAAASALSCGQANQDFDLLKHDIEIQDTYVFNENSRVVFGAGFTDSEVTSETFFNGGPFDVKSVRLFGSLEHRFNQKFLINAGFLWENEDLVDTNEVSPRVSLHYSPSKYHTIKFVASKAVRTPDLFEVTPDWNYFFRGLTPPVAGQTDAFFYFSAAGPFPDLESEEIVSNEIIWYARLPKPGLQFELKVFREELDDLISEKLQFFDFNPTNNGEVIIEGFEAEVTFKPTQRLTTRLAYSYQDLETDDFFETGFHTTHSGSIVVGYKFDRGYKLNGAYFANTEISGFDFHRYDITASKVFKLGDSELRGSLQYRYVPKDQGGAADDINRTFENDYDDSDQFYLTLDYTF